MIKIFVHALGKNGEPFIADGYEFQAVPRVGEEVVVDSDSEQLVLQVVGVTNFSRPSGDVMAPLHYISLKCKVVS